MMVLQAMRIFAATESWKTKSSAMTAMRKMATDAQRHAWLIGSLLCIRPPVAMGCWIPEKHVTMEIC
jgi:hypothetical protein